MPLTRSAAGHRAAAHKGSQNPRRNPSRQSTAVARPNASRAAAKSGRARPVYRDSSDTDDPSEAESASSASESESLFSQASELPGLRRRSTRTAARHGGRAKQRSHPARPPQSRPSPKKASKPGANGPRAATFSSPSKRRLTAAKSISGNGDELPRDPQDRIPDWTDPRLSFEFWVGVFTFARDAGDAEAPNTRWLLQAATTCRTLCEPALTAVYRCPTFRQASKAKRLASLLQSAPEKTMLDYRCMIQSLHIDIHVVPQSTVCQIIRSSLCLKEVIFYTPKDQPPYRELDSHVRWNYSDDILQALAAPSDRPDAPIKRTGPTMLRSWEWSGRLLGGPVSTFSDIVRVHQMPAFNHLKRLSFTNFQAPSLLEGDDEDDEGHNLGMSLRNYAATTAVADAIAQLKSLKHLVFESSTIMTKQLLSLLPKDLSHLELINCWEIESEDLAQFLLTHGQCLRALTLMHNQSLNLAFLTVLAEACPNLRELRMNLSYFRHHDSVNDSDPMYDFALLPDQVPTWPASLRVIDLEHIRNWSVETAEMFIQSLVDKAKDLPNLRHLVIKTMLDIPWQARATLRSKLRPMVERVFLRESEPPQSYATIVHGGTPHQEPGSRKRKRSSLSDSPLRRSSRIETHANSSPSRSRKGHKLRRRRLGGPVYKEPDTDDDEFDDSYPSDSEASEAQQDSAAGEPAIQGLCDVVSIVFDNQKPRELPFTMSDFVSDDGVSSGEEWNGDDDDHDNTIAF
ncbi:uncharacterized protein TRIREDRAFT_67108 [Trichoderma reesei QM6a]|uniref:Predicted protein n=1 Tax=Hypocrea jecorina (strain QM6a) TaxID=431241 RepID=G0RS82_HYPJQ|nr:uncharacterized protein TRIREDRAFT_67108 [Trichoderma reesei QM6a]EGR46031.1 predicted protein [Trichoderma reesei QM6a]